MADIVVRSDATRVVRLRDIANVTNGVVPQWVRLVEDGKPAVLFNVYEQPDGTLVTQSAASVPEGVLIGLMLAGVVLLLFLRSWRVTLTAVLVVPATLAALVLINHAEHEL